MRWRREERRREERRRFEEERRGRVWCERRYEGEKGGGESNIDYHL